jgi:hypothetical protein
MFDMDKCVVGDRLILRNGQIAVFKGIEGRANTFDTRCN